jgi:hypothetical protein
MFLDSLTMAEAEKKRNALVADAAEILKRTKKGFGSVTDAMKLAGMDTPLRENRTIQKQVYRGRKALEELATGTMPTIPENVPPVSQPVPPPSKHIRVGGRFAKAAPKGQTAYV